MTAAEQIAKVFGLEQIARARNFATVERMNAAMTCNCTCHVLLGGGTDTRRDRKLEVQTECWHCRLLADPHSANIVED